MGAVAEASNRFSTGSGTPRHRTLTRNSQAAQSAKPIQTDTRLSLILGSLTVMRRPVIHQRISKHLALLVALLSPLQAIQGTHVLCAVIGQPHAGPSNCGAKCSENHSSCGAHDALCHKNLGTSHLHESSSDCERSPVECPSDCWCRRPLMPQSDPPESESSRQVTQLVCRVERVVATTDNHELVRRTFAGRSSQNAESALEVCASLCRFLA